MILAYHGVAEVAPEHDPVRLFLSPESIRWQVRRLQSRGYRFVTMAEFARSLHAGDPLRATCALTFDDGTEDHATVLPGLLDELGVPGTVYVCPGLLGQPYPWAAPEAGLRFMTADELHAAAEHPQVEIGAHTNEHVELHEADDATAYTEMSTCKRTLEEMLGVEVPSFCYPRCHYSPSAPGAARRAGYTSAVTCGPRGSWNPYELRRESLHTPDGRVTFEFKSRGLYFGARDRAPFRLARWVTRPYRHRHERRRADEPR